MSTRDAAREIAAAAAIRAGIEALTDDVDAIRDTLEGETDLMGLVRRLVMSIGEDEAAVEGLTAYAAEIGERKRRISARIESCRALILQAMEIADMRRIETDIATISVRAVSPKLVVLAESDIPTRFWKAEPKLDRAALQAALKDGPVAGAELSNGGSTVMIKRT